MLIHLPLKRIIWIYSIWNKDWKVFKMRVIIIIICREIHYGRQRPLMWLMSTLHYNRTGQSRTIYSLILSLLLGPLLVVFSIFIILLKVFLKINIWKKQGFKDKRNIPKSDHKTQDLGGKDGLTLHCILSNSQTMKILPHWKDRPSFSSGF